MEGLNSRKLEYQYFMGTRKANSQGDLGRGGGRLKKGVMSLGKGAIVWLCLSED